MTEVRAKDPTPRILVVRPDRIGDVVLSTPVLEVLRRHYSKGHITFMVRELVAPLVRGLSSVDEVFIYEPDGAHRGVGGFFKLVSDIRARKIQVGIVLHSHWKIAAALFVAGVAHRVGPLSKLHSYFFYNRGVRQRRSQVEMHEADYGLQLLRKIGVRVGTRNVPTAVAVSPEARAEARAFLSGAGWDGAQPLIAVHPGMGGSALNWPENHFFELIRRLLVEGKGVLVTAGPAEGEILVQVEKLLGSGPNRPILFGGARAGTVENLAAVLSWSSVVVAPSTGPLHIAVALGKPVVTFFPPIRVQSAVRWGPYLSDESRASVLVPDVYCGRDFTCAGNRCHYFPCMKSLTVVQALEQVQAQLNRSEY